MCFLRTPSTRYRNHADPAAGFDVDVGSGLPNGVTDDEIRELHDRGRSSVCRRDGLGSHLFHELDRVDVDIDLEVVEEGFDGLLRRKAVIEDVLDGIGRGHLEYDGSSRTETQCALRLHLGGVTCSDEEVPIGLVKREDVVPS